MVGYYEIYENDLPYNELLLHYYDKQENWVVWPEYFDLECPECGKMNIYPALQRGINTKIQIRKGKDASRTDDNVPIFNSRVKSLLESLAANQISFFPIPNGDYFAAWPLRTFQADEISDPAFRYEGKRCRICNRYAWAGWSSQSRFCLPSDLSMGAILFGETPVWCVRADLVPRLREAKIKGWGYYNDCLA